MIRRALCRFLPMTLVVPLAVHSVPLLAILGGLGLAAYICRQVFLYKLGSKALDKAPAAQGAAIVRAVVGHTPGPYDDRTSTDSTVDIQKAA